MMNEARARELVNRYVQMGYPNPSMYKKMPRNEFEEGIHVWPLEYMEATLVCGKILGYAENFNMKDHGKTDMTEWGYRVKRTKEYIAYKNTLEGKKESLRAVCPADVRSVPDAARTSIEMHNLETTMMMSKMKEVSKQQLKLNNERYEQVMAIGKSISNGGYLRNMYLQLVAEYNKKIDNMPTNEETAEAIMKDKRKKRLPALLLSWLVVPFYACLRGADIVADSKLWHGIREGHPFTSLSGEHPFIGRLEQVSLWTIFLLALQLISFFEEGVMEVDGNLLVLNSLNAEQWKAVLKEIFRHGVVGTFFVVVAVRNIGGIIPYELAKLYSKIVSKASRCFRIITPHDYQIAIMYKDIEIIDYVGTMIKEAETVFENSRMAIIKNEPYGDADISRKQLEANIKKLESNIKKIRNRKDKRTPNF